MLIIVVWYSMFTMLFHEANAGIPRAHAKKEKEHQPDDIVQKS